MATLPTFFADDAARTARAAEVTGADWDTGLNFGASNACGIGINIGVPNLNGANDEFTLLDQRGDARTPQTSQCVGGSGLGEGTSGTAPDASIRSAIVSDEGDGDIGVTRENVGLADLATGWEAPVVP